MYKIFFGDRFLSIEKKQLGRIIPASVLSDEIDDLPEFITRFETDAKIQNLTILHDKPEKLFSKIKSHLKYIEAAGGLVLDPGGNFLAIHRLGKWDLPKGKTEQGERPDETALREVEEETGLHSLHIMGHLCDTYHTYRLKDKLVLKKTWWFLMAASGNLETKPQQEENINLAKWIGMERLSEIENDTYASIATVFESFRKLPKISLS
jgi:ADP-ribose pyrophosphatase YjhB (NUDIX family)